MTGEEKGKGKNLAIGAFLLYKLKVGKMIPYTVKKGKEENQAIGVAISPSPKMTEFGDPKFAEIRRSFFLRGGIRRS